VHRLFVEMFPGDGPLRLAGFSFGGAIATSLARRLAPRVTHLCLVSPGGFPSRRFGDRPIRSYKEAGDDERLFREICRHNLLVNMLSDPASVTEEAIDIQADGVRRARFDSRKVSGGGTLLGDLAQLTCRIRLLWGERDDSAFRPAKLLIGEIRSAVRELGGGQSPHAGVLLELAGYTRAPAKARRSTLSSASFAGSIAARARTMSTAAFSSLSPLASSGSPPRSRPTAARTMPSFR